MTQTQHTTMKPRTETKDPAVNQDDEEGEEDKRRKPKGEEPEKDQEEPVAAGEGGGQGDEEDGARGGGNGNNQGVNKPKKGEKVGGRAARQPKITSYFAPGDRTRRDDKSRGTDGGRN